MRGFERLMEEKVLDEVLLAELLGADVIIEVARDSRGKSPRSTDRC